MISDPGGPDRAQVNGEQAGFVLLGAHESPCAILMAVICALLLGYPYLDGRPLGDLVLGALNAGLLLTAAYILIRQGRRLAWFSFPLAILALLLQAIYLYGRNHAVYLLLGLVVAIFYAWTISQLLGYIVRRGRITADKIYAAATVYLLFGLLWASLFAVLADLEPASFVPDPTIVTRHPPAFYDFIYYSFGALTTAGSDGLAPVADVAKSLTILENLVGVLYVAVLIARLTGAYTGPPASGGR